ncbi:MAG TPA: hypothetical protein GX740_04465, partial [Acholeplasmataceae bacterium]|nr:hypothetical protein [Acholeplasmataceae bacterium]
MKKQRTITYLMSIIFSITILVQVIILLILIYFGNLPEKVKDNPKLIEIIILI